MESAGRSCTCQKNGSSRGLFSGLIAGEKLELAIAFA